MRGIFKLAALLGLASWLLVGPAHGQTLICYKSASGTGCTPVSAAAPLPVNASVSASISGFQPAATGTPISVTTGGNTGTLPAGTVVAAFNVGTTNTAYCKLGASATTSDIAIPPASWFAFTVGAATQLTCITSTSTTTVNMVGGSGLPTGAGGGGGGSGGGGGAITMASGAVASGAYSSGSIASGAYSSGSIASGAVASGAYAAGSLAAGAGVDGWDLTQGAKADSVCGTATGTCSVVALLKYLNTSVNAAIPAGTAIIGKVGIDQTTPGTTNAVSTTNWPTTVDTNSGNKSASTPRFVMATDQPNLTTPLNVRLTDGTNATVTDPCNAVTKLYKAFSQTATAVLVSGTSAKKTYVCSIAIIAGAAEIFNLTAGTGSTCGTNTVAVLGSTTAANGLSLAANGGLTLGNGASALAATTVNADDLCLQQSGSNRLSGGITYVQL